MSTKDEIRKHFTLYYGVTDFKLVEAEAARRRIPMHQLLQEWIAPHLRKLREKNGQS